MNLKRMGVINLTPDSFSDGGEISPQNFLEHVEKFSNIDLLDIGAESTAPMNSAISSEEEWERILCYLPLILKLKLPLSFDTYHPETIQKLAKIWIDRKVPSPLMWNDVSGKYDDFVHDFLKMRQDFQYIFCHNLAPGRAETSRHMDFISPVENDEFLKGLGAYFKPHAHPRVIFDPTLGFSKSFSQNWYILDHFHELQEMVSHDRWLVAFSRKSFLKKKYQTDLKEELDQHHLAEIKKLQKRSTGEVWIRTHRPGLL